MTLRKTLILLLALCSLCSCSDEQKAQMFKKSLKNGNQYLFQDIQESHAHVYYANNYVFYRHDLRDKSNTEICSLDREREKYICSNFSYGKSDIFYINAGGSVLKRNLITNKEESINGYGQNVNPYIGRWGDRILYLDKATNNCDQKIKEFNIKSLTCTSIAFDFIPEEHKDAYIVSVIPTNHAVVSIILNPDELDADSFLCTYKFTSDTAQLDLKQRSYGFIKVINKDNKDMIAASGDANTTRIFDIYGEFSHEFPDIYGWPAHRGLTSGDLISRSHEHNILCYMANDKEFVSSVYLFYYDGWTGEEVKINNYIDSTGDKISFTLPYSARQHVYSTDLNNGLVFYATAAMGDEYILVSFDYKTRKTSIIDKGIEIYFDNKCFIVTHYNGSESWYSHEGKPVQPRRSYDYFNLFW